MRYLLESSAWSVGGILLGYALGKIECDIREIKRILNDYSRKTQAPPDD